MLSIKEWRAMKEATGPAITTSEQQAEPDAKDWEFYHTKVQGRARQYLGWFVDEVSKKQLNLARKGFILQEIMDALGMTISEVVRSVSNIKRALAKKQAMQKASQVTMQPPVEQPTSATPQPVNPNVPT